MNWVGGVSQGLNIQGSGKMALLITLPSHNVSMAVLLRNFDLPSKKREGRVPSLFLFIDFPPPSSSQVLACPKAIGLVRT